MFWAYFIAALRSAAPGVGEGALALLSSTEPPTEAFVVTLLNDLAAVSDAVVVVLDDYHVIEEPQVRDGMAYLVEHLPAQIRLVIASRADPALPLARLRARGELVEIRAADLRFTLDEAAASAWASGSASPPPFSATRRRSCSTSPSTASTPKASSSGCAGFCGRWQRRDGRSWCRAT